VALWLVALGVFGAMIVEALRTARNERRQVERGGREPQGDVYKLMRLAYPLAFVAMLLEGAIRSGGALHAGDPRLLFAVGATLFGLGKALKWWAILVLGPAWTFRVVVVPGAPLVTRGPYRFFRHPNYLGVLGELAGVALMTGAVLSGPAAVVGFGVLMKKRMAVEERALAAGGSPTRTHV
jgi:methyltransferase